jgi:hypothetical protein
MLQRKPNGGGAHEKVRAHRLDDGGRDFDRLRRDEVTPSFSSAVQNP